MLSARIATFSHGVPGAPLSISRIIREQTRGMSLRRAGGLRATCQRLASCRCRARRPIPAQRSGNVTVRQGGVWQQPYTAKGDLSMGWDFAYRKGILAITNFDKNGPRGPVNVVGIMKTPGTLASTDLNKFSGPLLGASGAGPRSLPTSASSPEVRSGRLRRMAPTSLRASSATGMLATAAIRLPVFSRAREMVSINLPTNFAISSHAD